MNLCAIHSQWYVNHCVYCGVSEQVECKHYYVDNPYIANLTHKDWERYLQKLRDIQK